MDGLLIRYKRNVLHGHPLLEAHVSIVSRAPLFGRRNFVTNSIIQQAIKESGVSPGSASGSLGIQVVQGAGKIVTYPFSALPEGIQELFKKKGIAVRLERMMVLEAKRRFPSLATIENYPPVSPERTFQMGKRGIANTMKPIPLEEYVRRMDVVIGRFSLPVRASPPVRNWRNRVGSFMRRRVFRRRSQ